MAKTYKPQTKTSTGMEDMLLDAGSLNGKKDTYFAKASDVEKKADKIVIEVGSAQEVFFAKVFPKIPIDIAKNIYDTYISGNTVIIRWKVMSAIPVEATVLGSDYVGGVKSFSFIMHDTYAVEYRYTDSATGYAECSVIDLKAIKDVSKSDINGNIVIDGDEVNVYTLPNMKTINGNNILGVGDIVIPKGDTGPQGPKGDKGDPGSTSYNAETVGGFGIGDIFNKTQTITADGSQFASRQMNGELPEGLADVYNWGAYLSFAQPNARFEMYAPHQGTDYSGIWVRTGWDNERKDWKRLAFTTDLIPGPQGPAGPQGPEGPQGPAGTTTWSGITDKPSSFTPSSHASSSTTYGVGSSTSYGHVKVVSGDLNGKSATSGYAASQSHTHGQYLTQHQSLAGLATEIWVNNKGYDNIGTVYKGKGQIADGNSNFYASVSIVIVKPGLARIDFTGHYTVISSVSTQGLSLTRIASITGFNKGTFNAQSTDNIQGNWFIVNSKLSDAMGYGTCFENSGGYYKFARYYTAGGAVGGWSSYDLSNTSTTYITGHFYVPYS